MSKEKEIEGKDWKGRERREILRIQLYRDGRWKQRKKESKNKMLFSFYYNSLKYNSKAHSAKPLLLLLTTLHLHITLYGQHHIKQHKIMISGISVTFALPQITENHT